MAKQRIIGFLCKEDYCVYLRVSGQCKKTEPDNETNDKLRQKNF